MYSMEICVSAVAIIVGDGALDVPFRGVARFEIVQTMYANKGGRTLFAPTGVLP